MTWGITNLRKSIFTATPGHTEKIFNSSQICLSHKKRYLLLFFIKVLVFIGFGAFGVVSQTIEKFNIRETATILKPAKVNLSKFRMKKYLEFANFVITFMIF